MPFHIVNLLFNFAQAVKSILKKLKIILVLQYKKINNNIVMQAQEKTPQREDADMANITKNQIRKRAQDIADKLQELQELVQDLQEETSAEADGIEPYENKNELTPQQEERLGWLQDVADQLENAADNLQEAADALDNVIY